MVRAEIIRPDGQIVPAVILCAGLALVFWLMLCAPSGSRQVWAARMSAGPERLHGHGLSPPGKTKTPDPITQPSSGESLALAFDALAFCNIQDYFTTARSAVDWEATCFGFVCDSQEPVISPADWARNPSILY